MMPADADGDLELLRAEYAADIIALQESEGDTAEAFTLLQNIEGSSSMLIAALELALSRQYEQALVQAEALDYFRFVANREVKRLSRDEWDAGYKTAWGEIHERLKTADESAGSAEDG